MSDPSLPPALEHTTNTCVHCGQVFSPLKPKLLKDHLHLFHELSYSFTTGTPVPSSGINAGMVYTAQRKTPNDTLACIVPGCQLSGFASLIKYKKHLTKAHADMNFQFVTDPSSQELMSMPSTVMPSHGPIQTSTPALTPWQLSQPYSFPSFDHNIDLVPTQVIGETQTSGIGLFITSSPAEPSKNIGTELVLYQPLFCPSQSAHSSSWFHPYSKPDMVMLSPSSSELHTSSAQSSSLSDSSPLHSVWSNSPMDTSTSLSTSSGLHSNNSVDSIMTDASISVSGSDPSVKPLDPMVSSLINIPVLQKHGLIFHSHYRTVHCVNDACNTAILPYAVAGHLQNQHHFHFTAQEHKLLNEAIQELDSLSDASQLALPQPGQAPVEALKVYLLGHCCHQCLYAFTGTKASEGYYLAPIQTFFTVPEQYFAVNPALTKLQDEDPFVIFLKTVNPALEEESYNVLPAPDRVREVPPMLRTTGQHLHLKNYITDCCTVSSLLTLVAMPLMTAGSLPAKLHALVQQYMELVHDHSQASPLGVHALLIDFHRQDQRGKLWSAHDEPDTLNDYGLFLFHFIYAIILSQTSSETDYRFPLLDSDHKNADDLLVAVDNGTNQLISLHCFILPLLSPQASSSADIKPDKWQLVMECFVAVFCLCSDGQFCKPEHTTQVFAKIKYLVHGTCLYEAYEQHTLFKNDLYLAIEHYAKSMLHPGQSSPPATPWHHGLQSMLTELMSSQDTLIGGADQTMDIPPNIPDDWTDETHGYSWLKNSDCGVPQHALLKQLMGNKSFNLATIDHDGGLLHNIAAYHRLLAQISEITWLLAFLCYMVPGQVTHAMEFVDHKLSNST
ncbi:hypothetical protein EDD18DRAFT_1361936 [Armillaria luteobubalina]|uniref:Uncharacterized protein n=1 Tax=Armillaria luteobubalina TaxID=153913 RepID=A0AA39UCD7_9AGAR|nr:hypothetical protein EDD18DRAFT_1361936 [Armillaria luteobubalina]